MIFFFSFLSYFSFFNYYYYFFFTLQYCIGFATHQHESTTGVHEFTILTPLAPPSPYHLSGSSQCTSPKHPVSCIEPRLVIRFLYDIMHVQCHSPKSSHPHPLPQSPKDCSIHLCLFGCLTYRVIIIIFLNSIYIHILYWCFSFWLTSLYIIGSSFIHVIRTDSNVFFLIAE